VNGIVAEPLDLGDALTPSTFPPASAEAASL
jgi:hypothetical protein